MDRVRTHFVTKVFVSHMLTISSEAVEDLTGGVTSEIYSADILDKDSFWTNELLKVGKEFLYGCSTGQNADWLEPERPSDRRQGIHEGHAYSIMDAVEHSVEGETFRLVKIRYVEPNLCGPVSQTDFSETPGAGPDGTELGATAQQNGHLSGWNDSTINLLTMEYGYSMVYHSCSDKC